ncbi:hypothetical protein BCR34DRAFT_86336 [Clohesyomyces aquaticus]|uniref:Uncharacterized protein n=1 Tax=Clohesyomyces aquaticus TaxID=1231657 RepID=A0A1Y2A2N0_9PLEO|nr:hypothetical protein BCR34DRAFT_86336 [Clohesyomyces aquaticus]
MVRQLPPKPLISAGPTSAPPQRYLGETVVVNHYTGADKLIPAIPGFRTSAGECNYFYSPIITFLVLHVEKCRPEKFGDKIISMISN